MKTFVNVLVSIMMVAMTACTFGYQPTAQSYPPTSPQPSPEVANYPSPQPTVSNSQQGEVSLQIFYDQLSPY